MSHRYPFKFLDSYTKEDRDLFFGREEEVDALYHMVFQSDLVVVYGPSGSGKTSLIQCGLANRFQAHQWMDLNIRRGNDLNESLEMALQDAIGIESEEPVSDLSWLDEFNETDSEGSTATKLKKKSISSVQQKLKKIYRKHLRPIYLIFDQFEELFILGEANEESIFIQNVLQIMESEQPVTMIFSIREEYLGDLYEFEKQVPQLLRKKLRVESMSLDKVTQVMNGINCHPDSLVHIRQGEVEAFSAILFEKIRGHEKSLTIQLPYLQVFLDSHYIDLTGDEDRKTAVEFSVDGLVATGDIEDVLREFLDGQVKRIVKDLRNRYKDRLDMFGEKLDDMVIWSILSPFASEQGTKEPQLRGKAIERILARREFLITAGPDGKMLMRDIINDTIEALIKKRILRDLEDGDRIEIVHDSLAKRIAEKRSDEEIALMEVQRLIRSQSQLKEEARELFTEKQLNFIDPFLSRLTLNESEQDLVDESHRNAARQEAMKNRKRKRFLLKLGGLILGIFILILLTISYRYQSRIMTLRNSALYNNFVEQKEKAEQAILRAENALEKADSAQKEADRLIAYARDLEFQAAQSDSVAAASRFEASEMKALAGQLMNNARRDKALAVEGRERAYDMALAASKARKEANYNLAKIFEEKATTAIASNESDKAWLYSLVALNQDIGQANSLPLSLGRLLDPDIIPGSPQQISKIEITGGAWTIAISPDGKTMASGSSNGVLRFVDLRTGVILPGKTSHGLAINDLEFDGSGTYLATASDDGTIGIWMVAERRNVGTLSGKSGKVLCTAFDPQKKYLASGYEDGSVIIWDLESATIERKMNVHESGVNSIAYSPDGKTLASAASNGAIRLSSVAGASQGPVTKRNSSSVNSIDFAPDGRMLAAGSTDGSVVLWDVNSMDIRYNLGVHEGHPTHAHHTDGVLQIEFSSDGKWLASASLDQHVLIWSVEHQEAVADLEYANSLLSLAFSPDMQKLAIGQSEGARIVNFNPQPFGDRSWEVLPYIDSVISGYQPSSVREMNALSFHNLNYEIIGLDLYPTSAGEVRSSRATFYKDELPELPNYDYKFNRDFLRFFGNNNEGYPTLENEEVTLMPDNRRDASGVVLLDKEIHLPFSIEFQYSIHSSTGSGSSYTGDGIVFMFCKAIQAYMDSKSPPTGDSRGFIQDETGYGIHFITNGVKRIELRNGRGEVLRSTLYLRGKSSFPDVYSDGAWRNVRIEVTKSAVKVIYEKREVLSWEGKIDDAHKNIGVGAATGEYTGAHMISKVLITDGRNPKAVKMQGGATEQNAQQSGQQPLTEDADYLITNALSASKPLQAEGSMVEAGARIIQSTVSGKVDQRFRLHPLGDNLYMIRNVKSNKVLEVTEGDRVIQSILDSVNVRQHFYIEEDAQDFYFIISKLHGKVLEVEEASMESGAGISVSKKTGERNQLFRFSTFE